MTASRNSRSAKTAPTAGDLSGRCSAMVTLPANAPYHRLRCLGHPGHDGQHVASTSAPAKHAGKTQLVTLDLIWLVP